MLSVATVASAFTPQRKFFALAESTNIGLSAFCFGILGKLAEYCVFWWTWGACVMKPYYSVSFTVRIGNI